MVLPDMPATHVSIVARGSTSGNWSRMVSKIASRSGSNIFGFRLFELDDFRFSMLLTLIISEP